MEARMDGWREKQEAFEVKHKGFRSGEKGEEGTHEGSPTASSNVGMLGDGPAPTEWPYAPPTVADISRALSCLLSLHLLPLPAFAPRNLQLLTKWKNLTHACIVIKRTWTYSNRELCLKTPYAWGR
ncbi:hypothetical protein H6P81_012305 [Aristolochia fimbriata]|uniref:Uncharacterized protein n=1 Tax=Aristolochia fimbriata TaxID=158543 RepID=A0AAV7EEP2_ARIFI|nr:hypothetical protein H6P81_012305 [Aristolochia fimbriata]